jgi:ABC-type microcin C transport system permease subunit YejB
MFTALSRSLLLAGLSLTLMLVIAVPLGIIAALRRGRPTDVAVGVGSYIGVSMPEFVTATLVLITLGHPRFGLFPATGYVPLTEDFREGLARLVLPVLTVSVVLVAHVARMVRSELVDVLGTDYVRAARMKGLTPARVLFRHALRNALLPTITIVALLLSFVIYYFSAYSMVGLIIGVILMDMGLQGTHLCNQTIIFANNPAARNRINTVYMVSYFGGGAVGTFLGTQLWYRYQWTGVCLLGIIVSAITLLLHLNNQEKLQPDTPTV